MSYPRIAHRLLLLTAVLVGASPLSAAQRLTDAPIDMAADWVYQIDSADQLWLLYYGNNRQLRLRRPDGTAAGIAPDGTAEAPSGVGIGALESSGVVAVWRSKLPHKTLHLSRSDRPIGAAVEVGGDSQPAKRFVVDRIGDRLAMLWVGERPVEGVDATYHLYYRDMKLSDGALSDVEHVFPGYYPVWATSEKGVVVALSWLSDESNPRIVARTRAPGADRFAEPVTVAKVPLITPIFQAFRSGDRTIAIWLAQHTNMAEDFQLEGAYSDDDGKSWTNFAFESLRGFDIGSLDIASDAQGHLAMAVTARRRDNANPAKQDVFFVRSMDRGATWSSATRLRPPEVSERFRARYPTLTFGAEPGQLVVVWEDWRELRSRLYASVSTDFGQTWTLENVPLPYASGVNLSLNPAVQGVYQQAGRFHMIAQEAVDDGLKEKYLVGLSFTVDELKNLPAPVPEPGADGAVAATGAAAGNAQPAEEQQDERAELLKKRVSAFWEAMVKEDYAAAYALYDPFFRGRTNLDGFKNFMGRIHYAAHDLEEVSIDGPIAKVKSKIRYAIGPFRVPSTGEMVERPEKEVTVSDTWLWFDNNWYRQFYSEVNDTTYTLF